MVLSRRSSIAAALLALVMLTDAARADQAARWGDFSLPLCQSVAPSNHLGVGSGWSVVQPIHETVMGVGSIFSPPLACPDFRMELELVADGETIPDKYNLGKGDVGLLYAGGEWRPDRITRRGTYHRLRSGRLVSLGVESELIPLFGRSGFLLKATIANRTDRPITITLRPHVQPGCPTFVPLSQWTFQPPGNMRGAVRLADPAKALADGTWSNGKVRLTQFGESVDLRLDASKSGTAWLAIVATEHNEPPQRPKQLVEWDAETTKAWHDRLDWALRDVPTLESDIPGLTDYYRRSLVSGLVCIWENPAFVVNPYMAVGGLDGGAVCTYAWDIAGYTPNMMAMMFGEKCKPIHRRLSAIDLSKSMAFSPDGKGFGCGYSYSVCAMAQFTWALARRFGPDRETFDALRRLILETEAKYPCNNDLLDFGNQHNLLEMRGLGYEHFVPSPNAERVWCFERLADLGVMLGHDPREIAAWREKATVIRSAVKRELWDAQRKWFKCLYPDGRSEYVYSIQMFRTLMAMSDDEEILSALLSHLRPGAFLADYGVQSVSREDTVHFEVIDTDWSGGGAYVGNGPELVGILYNIGESERAWDVLQRFFWMGHHLPYYPQELLADRPAVPGHKRANCNSGLTHAEAILYGMAGFDPRPDGSVWLNPQPPKSGRIVFKGYCAYEHTIDVTFDNGTCRVACDGVEVYAGPPRQIEVASRKDKHDTPPHGNVSP